MIKENGDMPINSIEIQQVSILELIIRNHQAVGSTPILGSKALLEFLSATTLARIGMHPNNYRFLLGS